MKKSFKDEDRVDGDVDVDEAALAVVEDDGEMAVARPMLALGAVSAEFSTSDVRLPTLRVGQPMSKMENVSIGQLVYNKELVLAQPNQEVDVVVLNIDKWYEERVDYDPDKPGGQRWDTYAQMTAAGFSTVWVDNKPSSASEVAQLTLLIKKPEGIDAPCFTREIAGEQFALAVFAVHKTAYTSVAKEVFSRLATDLSAKGPLFGRFKLKAVIKEGKFKYALPMIRLASEHSAEFVAEMKSALNM